MKTLLAKVAVTWRKTTIKNQTGRQDAPGGVGGEGKKLSLALKITSLQIEHFKTSMQDHDTTSMIIAHIFYMHDLRMETVSVQEKAIRCCLYSILFCYKSFHLNLNWIYQLVFLQEITNFLALSGFTTCKKRFLVLPFTLIPSSLPPCFLFSQTYLYVHSYYLPLLSLAEEI